MRDVRLYKRNRLCIMTKYSNTLEYPLLKKIEMSSIYSYFMKKVFSNVNLKT